MSTEGLRQHRRRQIDESPRDRASAHSSTHRADRPDGSGGRDTGRWHGPALSIWLVLACNAREKQPRQEPAPGSGTLRNLATAVDPSVRGTTREHYRRIIRRSVGSIVACYQDECPDDLMPAHPAIRFSIAQNGDVTSVAAVPVEGKDLQTCVQRVLKSLPFPPHHESQDVVMDYPRMGDTFPE